MKLPLVLGSTHQGLVEHEMLLVVLRGVREGVLVAVRVAGHAHRLALDCFAVLVYCRMGRTNKGHLVRG